MPEKFGRYYEPFCGAAAVFLAMDPKPKAATLSDLNAELINCYVAIRDDVEAVIRQARKLLDGGVDEEHYYTIRAWAPTSSAARAARFLFLQATSFNGIWRENTKTGQHNVPFSKDRAAAPPYDAAHLRHASLELKRVELQVADAFEILKRPKRGDVVYCDSPFMGTFTNYVAQVWTPQQAERLAAACFKLSHQGVHVIVSEADTPVTRKLYKGARLASVSTLQNIAADADARGHRQDLVITFGK